MLKLTAEGKKTISEYVQQGQEGGVFPGAALGIILNGQVVYREAFGYALLEPECRSLSLDTIFDLASLTKVMATTTAILKLMEQGQLNIWDPLSRFYPEWPEDKSDISIHHLMTHSSGYQAIVRLWDQGMSYEEKIQYIINLPLEYPTGSQVIYSDPNFILLGDLVQRVSGQRLDSYLQNHVFGPLGMERTAFNPLKKYAPDQIAATEQCDWRGRMVNGEVHDENAASFDGVSGHAGLFSCLDDTIRFVQMILNEGQWEETRILTPQTVKLMRRDETPALNQNRGLGWDLAKNPKCSGGVLLSEQAFGHTGFTGTSLWIDPELQLGVVFLTNRVHPTRENVKLIPFRSRLHNLIVSTLFAG